MNKRSFDIAKGNSAFEFKTLPKVTAWPKAI